MVVIFFKFLFLFIIQFIYLQWDFVCVFVCFEIFHNSITAHKCRYTQMLYLHCIAIILQVYNKHEDDKFCSASQSFREKFQFLSVILKLVENLLWL